MNLITTLTAFSLSTISALAQEKCAPDFKYTSAIGHEQGASSRAALGKVFKAAKSRNFEEFMAIAADPYIQHSPDLPDGWKPVWDLLDKRPKGFSSELLPWLGDQGYLDNGNYLVMLREVNRGDGTPKSKIFDLMYFDKNGLYAEHWDMRQALSQKTASGRSETAQAKEFADNPVDYSIDTEESNKRLVATFLNVAFNGSQLETALNLYVSPTYVQHNQLISDGIQPVIDAFKAGKIPALCYDIKFVLAQNDLVFVYSKVTSKEGVSAVVDLIRVRDNKMVEHWDVVQAVPADKDMPHKNGMF
ncbi:MAG: hypothetical protein WBD37_15915 [Anderseniella sp.]